TRGVNLFCSLFIWPAAGAPLAPPPAPSIQTTALEASGTGAPARRRTTRPSTVPPGGGDGRSARRRARRNVISKGPRSKNHSIGRFGRAGTRIIHGHPAETRASY